MPEGIEWPQWKGAPLAFLCQIDLSEIPKEYLRYGLPGEGLLFFFYNQEQETWGFDPNDKGSWKVIYINTVAKECIQKEAPEGLKKDYIYKQKNIAFSLIQTYPDLDDSRIEPLNLTKNQTEEYINLQTSVYKDNPCHQLFGYQSPVQNYEWI